MPYRFDRNRGHLPTLLQNHRELSPDLNDALTGYQLTLEREGPAGLSYLNARVPHRYTAVYNLTQGILRNTHLYDKHGEVTPAFLQEVPLQESFCQFVVKDGLFCTSDSSRDERLDGHKYQGVMGSYHGLPLLDNFGELYGTLCHFDTASLALPDEEFEFFQRAARILPKYLKKTPV
jgi:hypothetical protein